MVRLHLRRVFRVLWALCAVALLAGLPALVLDFKRNQYSVHYQVLVYNQNTIALTLQSHPPAGILSQGAWFWGHGFAHNIAASLTGIVH